MIKYPKSVFFIITNEFCERFCYYGMKTVLFLYLTNKLMYDEKTATVLYHSWAGLCYFFPIFGGILADTLLGKFKTIVYLSVIYLLGNIFLSVVSATELHLPQRELSLLGLLLIAFGTGGIKPCVSSFGGDQFILPQQKDQLDKFFSFFYFAINAGSLISTFITPMFREDLKCFGEDSCFPVAFGVPALLMLVSIVIFLSGRPLYKINQPKGNICLSVCSCIVRAIRNRSKLSKSNLTKDHWLDYADDRYSQDVIEDIKGLLRVLVLFVPLPVFWALFDQQGSKWTSQAVRMSGDISGTSFSIKPDQMQVINPLLILALIPIFQYWVYPVIAKIGINTPLRKLSCGGLLAALAFIISALVEFQINKTAPNIPTSTQFSVRIYNSLDCSFTFNAPLQAEGASGTLAPLDMLTFTNIPIQEKSKEFSAELQPGAGCTSISQKFNASLLGVQGNSTAYYLVVDEQGKGQLLEIGQYDDLMREDNSAMKIRVLFTPELEGKTITFENSLGFSKAKALSSQNLYTEYIKDLPTGSYKVTYDNKTLADNLNLKHGGVYVLILPGMASNKSSTLLTIVPGWVHMLWLLPQYIVITAAEIMFSITGFEFAFTQAPVSMKSVLSACWLLTVAFGNVIVVIVAEAKFFENQAYEFLLFAGLMVVDMLIFMFLALSYKYVTYESEDDQSDPKSMGQSSHTLNSTVPDG